MLSVHPTHRKHTRNPSLISTRNSSSPPALALHPQNKASKPLHIAAVTSAHRGFNRSIQSSQVSQSVSPMRYKELRNSCNEEHHHQPHFRPNVKYGHIPLLLPFYRFTDRAKNNQNRQAKVHLHWIGTFAGRRVLSQNLKLLHHSLCLCQLRSLGYARFPETRKKKGNLARSRCLFSFSLSATSS